MMLSERAIKMMRVKLKKIKIIRNNLSIKVGIYSLKSLLFCRYAIMLVTVTAQTDSDAHVVINLALEEVWTLGWAAILKASQQTRVKFYLFLSYTVQYIYQL